MWFGRRSTASKTCSPTDCTSLTPAQDASFDDSSSIHFSPTAATALMADTERRKSENSQHSSSSFDNENVIHPKRASLPANVSLSTSSFDSDRRVSRRKGLKQFLFRPFATTKAGYVVFGEQLDMAVHRTCLVDNMQLPAVFRRCLLFIEHKGISQHGIYRQSAPHTQVAKLKSIFEQEGDLDLHAYFLDPSSNDINTAASVLKLYLRSLPEPLLTNLLQDDFHKVIRSKHNESLGKQLSLVRQLLIQLPRCNYLTLGWLFKHLHRIAQHSTENKMTFENLFIVFAPTLHIGKDLMRVFIDRCNPLFPDVELIDCTHVGTRQQRLKQTGKKKFKKTVSDLVFTMPPHDVLNRTEHSMQLLSQFRHDIIQLEKCLIEQETAMAVCQARNVEYPNDAKEDMKAVEAQLATARQCYQRLRERLPDGSDKTLDLDLLHMLRESYTTLAYEHAHLKQVQNALLSELHVEEMIINRLEDTEAAAQTSNIETPDDLQQLLHLLQEDNQMLSKENTKLLQQLNSETSQYCKLAGIYRAVQPPLKLMEEVTPPDLWSPSFQKELLSDTISEQDYTVFHRWSNNIQELVIAPLSADLEQLDSDTDSVSEPAVEASDYCDSTHEERITSLSSPSPSSRRVSVTTAENCNQTDYASAFKSTQSRCSTPFLHDPSATLDKNNTCNEVVQATYISLKEPPSITQSITPKDEITFSVQATGVDACSLANVVNVNCTHHSEYINPLEYDISPVL